VVASNDDSGSSDSSEDESDEEAPAPKANGTKPAKDDSASESESDSSEDDSDDEAPAPKAAAARAGASSDEESDSDNSASDSDDSSDESEEEAPPTKKRKAETAAEPVVKKTKTEGTEEEGIKNLFVGNLSWNVDEEWLKREFEEFGEITGCRVITDRETQRPKGYVKRSPHT
jgi:nucleolin